MCVVFIFFMRVVIGSLNRAKGEAVRNVFNKVFENIDFEQVNVSSGVREQPLCDDEAILGAINRAEGALKKFSDFDFGVGLEGTVNTNKYGMFIRGWVAIVSKDGVVSIGSSGSVLLPHYLRERIEAGEELGPVIQDLMNDSENEIRHSLGALGVLTNGLYTRVDQFENAVSCALSKFVASKYYKN